MPNNIDANAVYLLETYVQVSNESIKTQMYNPIASKVNAVVDEADQKLWGVINWYDPANQQFHVIEVREKPKIEGKDIKVSDMENTIHKFVFVTEKIYNTKIKALFEDAPNLKSDKDVQSYLKGQI